MRNKIHIMTILTINLIWLMLLQGMCLGVDSWRAVIVKSQNDYETGKLPGEGMQYPRSMVRSYSDPNYIYWAHDCSPGWRSRNAGETWERSLAKGVGTVFGKSIEVDPANPNTVLMIVDNQWDTSEVYFHGLYKSTDGGDNWGLVLSLACAESDRSYKHNIAYALSTISGGEAKVWYAAFAGQNIYKSTDGGNSWSQAVTLNNPNYTTTHVLYVHPTDSNTFYLGSNGGLYRSTDGGSTINPLGDLPSGEVATIQIDLNNPNVLYVAVKNKGAYKSTNAGTNFAAIKTDNNTIGLSVNLGNTNVMYFLKTSAIYVSQNGGSSWSTIVSHPREGLGRETGWGSSMIPWDGIGAIIPNPKSSGEAVGYGEAYLWKTTNCIDFYHADNLFSGYVWTCRNGMLFDSRYPNRFGVFGADKGLFISENAGKYYEFLETPYSILTNWGYAGNSNDMKAGAFQPRTSAFVASGGGVWGWGTMGIVWSSGNTGPWVATKIDGVNWNANDPNFRGSYRHYFYRPDDPNILFTTDVKSTDGGKTFTHISFLVNNGLQIYGMSKSNPNILYAMNVSGSQIYRSIDGGNNWSLYVSKAWYAYASGAVNTYDLVFDIDPVDCNKIYTMYQGGDLASFDGTNWHPFGLLSYIRSLPANLQLVSLDPKAEYPAIGAVIVDPNNNSVIYATVCHAGVSPVYRSINGGSTWEDISYNLPRSNYGPAFSINPYSGEIFVGGASGTWVFPPPYNQNTPIYANSVIVNAANSNQTLVLNAIGNKSVSENSLLTFTVNASDADGDAITYSATGLPSGATFVGQTFSWTPDYNQAGSYPVIFIASDGKAQDSKIITITVNNVNRPPVLVPIGDKSVNVSNTLSFSISATDADGDPITYSAQNLPSGATFVGQTFSWTPDYNQAGSYPVIFIASDGKAQDSKTITITVNSAVNNVNRTPVLSKIGDKSVHTNNLLAFDVNATNPDGNTITYSATGLPIGATFAGQRFRWTPDPNQGGTYHVTFIASDGLLQDSETITITVYNTDMSAPTVSGWSPAANSIQVPLDKLVILNIADNGDGVDANSVTIKVNGNIVYMDDTTDYNSPYGCCHRTGTKADYTFIYQSHAAFDYDQNVSVVVNAKDLAGNVMSPYSYSFVTETRSFGENKIVNSSSKNISNGLPATVRDNVGNIWVAWHAGVVSSSGMKRGIYVGKLPAGADTFGTNVREANNTNDRCNATIAIDAYDKLYLAWQDNRRKKWDIYMSTSVDGINWSAETRVTGSDNNAVNPVIAVDHSMPPKAYIAWQDDRAGNQEIYIASSSDGFATKTISRITSDSSDHIKPAIAVDSANTVYVVWADSRNGSSDIYGAASNNGPWTNVPIVTKPGSQTNPAIATEATGAILHLLWVDDTAGNKDIYYAASNGLPKTSLAGRNIVDDNSGTDQLTPAIITTGSTGAGLRVFACWQDMRNIVKNRNTALYFVDVNHGKETNIFVGNNTTSSNQSAPVIGVDRYGYPYLVWVDDRNQNTDIYYVGSTFVHSNALASQNISPASDAIIGTKPANITGVDDVSVVVPAGAYPCELNITISKVENPPKLPVSLFTFPYEFGPSGTDFNQPVTIIIPYSVSASNNPAFAYWYNTLTDALSQQGITNVEIIAISPILYAIRFKTTHFTQFIVGGSVNSSIQVTKCTIIAGSKDNSDNISISGKMGATAGDFDDATVIEVTVDSNNMVNPCVLTFPINSKTLKKDKYSYSDTENGVKKSFKYDVKTHSFVSTANNVNLSGLDCPLTFDINVGDYIGTAEVNETIVNGSNKPIPIILLMGVKYSLKVDKCQVKPGNKKPNTDQLLVKGSFTIENTDVDMANRVSEGLVVILGTQTFTIPTNELKAGNGKFTCSKAEVTEGGIAMASFDFNKCSFMLTISNTNITASSGTVDFGVAFAGYSQIRQITLM